MKDGAPFGLAGLWENWRNPSTGRWERSFAIITVPSNVLVRQIHDRMPAILEPAGYERWLGVEPDPHDLLISYPSEPMTIWPISTRVNKPRMMIRRCWIVLATHSTSGLHCDWRADVSTTLQGGGIKQTTATVSASQRE